MNCNMHFMIVTTLSMIMTFALYCALKDTRADAFFLQNIFIDVINDLLLGFRCSFNKQNGKFIKNMSSRLHSIVLVNQKACDYIVTSDDYDKINLLILISILQITMQFLLGVNQTVYYILPVNIYNNWWLVYGSFL